MNEIAPSPSLPHRKHLLSSESLTRSSDTRGDADLTRHHGQGNGVRVHGIYFAAVSLAALVIIVAAIVLAVTMM